MEKIFYSDYFRNRTTEQQEIINLITDIFPSSGYPKEILLFDNIIVISSRLVDLSIGYKHSDYVSGNEINRLCIYKKQRNKLLLKENVKHPINAILQVGNQVLFGTGTFGENPAGELLAYDIERNSIQSCTGEIQAILGIKNHENGIALYTFFPLGNHKGEERIYRVNTSSDFNIDLNALVPNKIISADEEDETFEALWNSANDTVTIDVFKTINN